MPTVSLCRCVERRKRQQEARRNETLPDPLNNTVTTYETEHQYDNSTGVYLGPSHQSNGHQSFDNPAFNDTLHSITEIDNRRIKTTSTDALDETIKENVDGLLATVVPDDISDTCEEDNYINQSIISITEDRHHSSLTDNQFNGLLHQEPNEDKALPDVCQVCVTVDEPEPNIQSIDIHHNLEATDSTKLQIPISPEPGCRKRQLVSQANQEVDQEDVVGCVIETSENKDQELLSPQDVIGKQQEHAADDVKSPDLAGI